MSHYAMSIFVVNIYNIYLFLFLFGKEQFLAYYIFILLKSDVHFR